MKKGLPPNTKTIGATSKDSEILIDGKKISQIVTGIWIKMLPGENTKVTLELLA